VISFRLDSKPVTACLVREVERFDGEKTIDAHWLLDAVFEGIEDGILIVEPKTLRIHRCNQAAARIFGTSVATLLGRSAAEFLADEPHGDEIVTTISSKLPFLHSIHLDLEMKRSNGSRFPALHGISEILGDADAVIAWMWVVTDMTQRVFLNRTLIDLETRYRLLFDRTADPLIIIDALSRKIIDANPATEVQLGYTRAELIGLGMEDITPPSRRTGMVDDFKSLRPGENASIEGVNLTKTGEQIPVLLGTVLTEFEGRRVYIVSCRDISQQKILEMERLRLQKIEATRELAGGLAHELSQPLQALITIVDILLQTSLNPDKQSQLLQKIPPSVERMAILVEQMKHLVRVETKPYTRADAIVDLQHSSENE
jgi:PAS domain S-box-containing protein